MSWLIDVYSPDETAAMVPCAFPFESGMWGMLCRWEQPESPLGVLVIGAALVRDEEARGFAGRWTWEVYGVGGHSLPYDIDNAGSAATEGEARERSSWAFSRLLPAAEMRDKALRASVLVDLLNG